ncbi:MAG: ABC transporter ATP-binding protein [Reyranellaceae bacterium]
MLKVDELTAGYFPGVSALSGVSLKADRGQMISVIGANGAGKSTLLGSIFGIVPHVRGGIALGDASLVGLKPHEVARAGVRLVPENRGTLPSLSVEENLLLGGLGLPKQEARERLERQLQRFPRLRERFGQRAGMLSGGEQQMLAIARAMMAQPRLLLLDEPSQGLAPVVVEQIFGLLAELRGADIAIVLVEQDVGLSLEVSDYSYVLEKGRIALHGPSSELGDNPYVREAFLGVA